jgi:hypothetical protein
MQANQFAQQSLMQTAEFKQQAAMFGEEAALRELMQSAEFAQQKAMFNLDSTFKLQLATADFDNKITLQKMADDTKGALAAIEMEYKQAISGSESAERLYTKAIQNISDIAMSDLDATGKTTAINNQLTYLRSGMGLMEAVSGLELDSLLKF